MHAPVPLPTLVVEGFMRLRLLYLVILALILAWSPPAPAATTCAGLRIYCSGTAASGNWTAFILPAGTAYVTLEVSGAAWVDGPEGGYTDGAARSSGGRASTSGEVLGIPIRLVGATTTIWVAGNGGSRTVTVYPAGVEAQ